MIACFANNVSMAESNITVSLLGVPNTVPSSNSVPAQCARSSSAHLELAQATGSGDPDDGTKAVDPVKPHRSPGMGSVDHQTVADEHADVADVSRSGAEEDEIAGHDRLSRAHCRPGVVLILGDTGKADPGLAIDGLYETGAVEAPARFTAPHVRDTEKRKDVVHRRGLGGRLARGHQAHRSVAHQIAADAARRGP